MDLEKTRENLEQRGFIAKTFATAADAAAYLDGAIDGATVGFGGSITLQEMGLYEKLSAHNEVIWHWKGDEDAHARAAQAQVYIASANGLAETGEIVNIDGAGNRVAGTLYGHERVYFVIGRNKLAPTFEEALWRARNIAAPKNAQRLGKKTPCAIKGDRCYDCKSLDRICRGLVVLWKPMMGMEQSTEVLLVDEDLGY